MPPVSGQSFSVPAVVVGLCVHGLALVRSLGHAGVPVHALEADRDLPGCRTRLARIHYAGDINGPGLIDALLELRGQMPADEPPVLFLTNDNMVRTVGRHWDQLDGLYRLSWAACREQILALLDKASLEAHCQTFDLPYPRSRVLHEIGNEPAGDHTDISYPCIVKPTRPLSGFKVRLAWSQADLERLAAEHPKALPFLMQHWIEGDDRRNLFVAFYLDRGEILATYAGRKLAAKPQGLGQTTAAESFPHAAAQALTQRFFAPLKLSGPVSLEVKLDADDLPWIIEPTLGRTDYWLDCCVANGVDLPLLEYLHQCGKPFPAPTQTATHIWFDTERSPLSWLHLRMRNIAATPAWKPRFAYWDRSDQAPFRHALLRLAQRSAARVLTRLRRLFSARTRDSFSSTIRSLGWINGPLYLLAQGVDQLSRGRIRIIKYDLVSQPVSAGPLVPPHRGAAIEVREIHAGDPLLRRMGHAPASIDSRFSQGGRCLAALLDGELAGFMWWVEGAYREDEVRCTFVPQPLGKAVWDFDVFVAAGRRYSPVFARLWETADRELHTRGFIRSCSRISAFKPESLSAHRRLGARITGKCLFICLGRAQLMFATQAPWAHVSLDDASRPVLRVGDDVSAQD